MKKTIKKTILLLSTLGISGLTLITHSRDRGFYFRLTSGSWSPWVYSEASTKHNDYADPVVEVLDTYGATDTFEYGVFNSEREKRTELVKGKGKFRSRLAKRREMKAGYYYYLGVKRAGGQFWDEATSIGFWSPN